jgi:hypothetical protein
MAKQNNSASTLFSSLSTILSVNDYATESSILNNRIKPSSNLYQKVNYNSHLCPRIFQVRALPQASLCLASFFENSSMDFFSRIGPTASHDHPRLLQGHARIMWLFFWENSFDTRS